jgi:hypothetical protein
MDALEQLEAHGRTDAWDLDPAHWPAGDDVYELEARAMGMGPSRLSRARACVTDTEDE